MRSRFQLVENRYGKSRVRLMKVTRQPEGNDLLEWTVQVLLQGDFDAAHYEGDNRKILPTDTMKNTVYSGGAEFDGDLDGDVCDGAARSPAAV